MNKEIFVDAVSTVHVAGNMVRIDLMTLQPHLKSENDQPVYDVSQRIIMPLEGFVSSFAIQENMIKQLLDMGVLKNSEVNEKIVE